MTTEEARQLLKDLENTVIPFTKMKFYNAQTLASQAEPEGVVANAKREVPTYKEQLIDYKRQVRELKKML